MKMNVMHDVWDMFMYDVWYIIMKYVKMWWIVLNEDNSLWVFDS